MNNNPILNNPYEEPKFHYATAGDGSLNYNDIKQGRRIFADDNPVIPTKQGPQSKIWEVNDFKAQYGQLIINLLRQEVGKWRNDKYPNTTGVTKELLLFWFENEDRHETQKLFFAQREAVETAIWLNEVAEKLNSGQHILNKIKEAQAISNDNQLNLQRISFKMATGSGKTVVMACLILYHFFNRRQYKNDTRFADNFLIVAPGVTIRDRLSVLFVDTTTKDVQKINDYYHLRSLVPQKFEKLLLSLNSKIVITNYHQLEPKALQGNKRSPFDGKINSEGNKTSAKEDFSQVAKRLFGSFKKFSRLLIINDEAHHCYLPLSKGKTKDNEDSDENAKAAIWFSGLVEIAKKYKLSSVYDLSATPYFLQGSGYNAYSLFPWVVSDFGLIEAIESGLVKIPFLPESDNSQELTMPFLRNLYEHVKDKLPKKGQKKIKSEAKKEGVIILEEKPKLPSLIKNALDQFYNHYLEYDKGIRKKGETSQSLFTAPPVFIIVCNNTTVSKEVYKYIAGYEYAEDETGKKTIISGAYELFSNFDSMDLPKRKAPTLLIDSDALDNSDQINAEFKKVFNTEIEEFKKEFSRIYGQGSAEKITDSEILREIVNTVGRPGKLGAHIRCVVSVGMLTEGWDANTVTHIMGIRAFGSQLLCEQVAGRALRRQEYFLQGYDKEGNPTDDKRKIVDYKYPPEYAHIIGIPFTMFKSGKTQTTTPVDFKRIFALSEREKQFEIEFPNVDGYRVEIPNTELKFDFTNIDDYEIDGSKFPTETTMENAFSSDKEILTVTSILEKREQNILFNVTKELIKYHFSDEDSNPDFSKFNQLKEIVKYWYNNKIRLLNIQDHRYKKLVFYDDLKKVVDNIRLGINPHFNNQEFIKPVFNFYNKFGSTKHVTGHTSREVYATTKSHVNYVVADTKKWEQIAAKSLEELPQVVSYVKNAFLNFKIPYISNGEDRNYLPDFIAVCKTKSGKTINLIIEITGMNQEKAEKKWFVENRWLPAVNAVKEKYQYNEWHFIEIAGEIRDIKNELLEKLNSVN